MAASDGGSDRDACPGGPPPPGRPVDIPTTARPLDLAPPPWQVRLLALLVFAAAAAVLGIAVWLQPDPRGYGTHEQLRALGQGPCGWLGWTGYPCPTCGMTTAFAHPVRGQVASAIAAQPGGFILALATALVGFGALGVLVRGRLAGLRPRWLTPFALFTSLRGVLIGGWAIKLAIGLLTHTLPVR